jgi:polysaccharide biosynthesis/export protein
MRRRFQLPFLAVGVLLLGSVVPGCGPKGVFIEASTYVSTHRTEEREIDIIGKGDAISVRVFGEATLSSESLIVSSSGMITLPLLGDQKVVGLTPQAVGVNIGKALEPYLKDPHVTVVLTPAPIVIHVMGEIGSTGRKEYHGKVLLPEVLAESGALSQFANRKAIFVLRGKDRIRFNYRDILRGLPPARTFRMEDGDFVVVE